MPDFDIVKRGTSDNITVSSPMQRGTSKAYALQKLLVFLKLAYIEQWPGRIGADNMTNYQLVFTAQNLQLTRYLTATDSNDAMQQVRNAFPHDIVIFSQVNTIASTDIPPTEAMIDNSNNGMAPLTQQGE